MGDLEGYINFWPEFEGDIKIAEGDLCFIYKDKQLLFKKAEDLQVPRSANRLLGMSVSFGI